MNEKQDIKMLDLLLYAFVGGILLYAFHKWATVNEDYFAKRKMKYLDPKFLVGNTLGLFTLRYIPSEFLDSIYYRFPNEKYVSQLLSLRIS